MSIVYWQDENQLKAEMSAVKQVRDAFRCAATPLVDAAARAELAAMNDVPDFFSEKEIRDMVDATADMVAGRLTDIWLSALDEVKAEAGALPLDADYLLPAKVRAKYVQALSRYGEPDGASFPKLTQDFAAHLFAADAEVRVTSELWVEKQASPPDGVSYVLKFQPYTPAT